MRGDAAAQAPGRSGRRPPHRRWTIPRGSFVDIVIPFLPLVAGTALSAWRFRAHEPIGGLVFALGGVIAMVLVVLVRDGTFRR